MDAIALAAGTALVTAMATDAWQQARAGMVLLWRRAFPEQADTVEEELADVRAQLLAARQDLDPDTERALTGSWQVRLQQLLRINPDLATELQRVLEEDLLPALSAAERTRIGSITMQATAREHGRVYQAGRDLNITEQ